jgi:hypothetical protein
MNNRKINVPNKREIQVDQVFFGAGGFAQTYKDRFDPFS